MALPWHWLDSAVHLTHPHLASRYDTIMVPQLIYKSKPDRWRSACVTALHGCCLIFISNTVPWPM